MTGTVYTIFVGVVVGGVVVEEVFTIRDQAAIIRLTSIVNNSWLVCGLPNLLHCV